MQNELIFLAYAPFQLGSKQKILPRLEKKVDQMWVRKIQNHLFSEIKIVSTFDTKVAKYLCSGWFFFLQTKFDFSTSRFDGIFSISFKRYCCPELKFEKIFHL